MIEFKNIIKKYKRHVALSNLNLKIPKGKTVALIGPSGCGKTTTLKMVNRLINPTSGKISVNDQDISGQDVIKLRRSMGFVIQNIGLFPHMTVRENIEIIARVEKRPAAEISRRTLELMDIIGLENDMLDRYPAQLSGGQQQRIGVARAFALDPEIILMDEPFSALDPISRGALQDELASIQDQLHKTILFVTHDMEEAIRVADLICIMKDGHVVQYDTPNNILHDPADDFVTEFIGKKRIWSSPDSIPVSDVMNERVVTCTDQWPLSRCLDKMEMESVDTMFVIERHNRTLLGILTVDKIQRQKDRSRTAASIMQVEYAFASPESHITDTMQDIEKFSLTCLPVVSAEGKLLGVVTKNGLFATLSRYYIETQEA